MDNKINTFELSSKWFAYVAENKNIKNNHTSLYFYILNKCNLLFWKKHFGLPTDSTMESLNISSYKTYIKTLTELSDTGFIKIIERSKNQHTSNIIEVVKNTKATTKATTNSLLKQEHTQCQSTDQVNVSIIKLLKQVNNKTIKTDKQIKVLLELKDSIIKNYTKVEETKSEDENNYGSKPSIKKISLGEFENIEIEEDKKQDLENEFGYECFNWMIEKLGAWMVGKNKTVKSARSLKAYFKNWVHRSYLEEKEKQNGDKKGNIGYDEALANW